MRDIWNPWHGCIKVSEGCRHCYMYALDRQRGMDGRRIFKTKDFLKPLARDRAGRLRMQPGEFIRVCMTSDVFLEEADAWRAEMWAAIRLRSDVKFYLLTKRAERIAACLPPDWGDGWENVMLCVTAENQGRADERIPILVETPAKHRGLSLAPLLGPVSIAAWLKSGAIELVSAGGENYGGERPCDFDWIRSLRRECEAADVRFVFLETGTVFVKDGRTYRLEGKRLQTKMAWKSGMSFPGRAIEWALADGLGLPIPEEALWRPAFDGPPCAECAGKLMCNGCSHCGRCGGQSS